MNRMTSLRRTLALGIMAALAAAACSSNKPPDARAPANEPVANEQPATVASAPTEAAEPTPAAAPSEEAAPVAEPTPASGTRCEFKPMTDSIDCNKACKNYAIWRANYRGMGDPLNDEQCALACKDAVTRRAPKVAATWKCQENFSDDKQQAACYARCK